MNPAVQKSVCFFPKNRIPGVPGPNFEFGLIVSIVFDMMSDTDGGQQSSSYKLTSPQFSTLVGQMVNMNAEKGKVFPPSHATL